MHTRSVLSISLPGNSLKDLRTEVLRVVKQLHDSSEYREGTQVALRLPVEWYHGVVDALRNVCDLEIRILPAAVYDLYVAKKPRPDQHVPNLATVLPPRLNEVLLDFQRKVCVSSDGSARSQVDSFLGSGVCLKEEWEGAHWRRNGPR